jgi:hypothetical protein
LNFDSFSITTDRAGMLIPRARVSVANTTLASPAEKAASTASLNGGTIPAWWAAMPASRPASHRPYPSTRRSSSDRVSALASAMARMASRSSSLVRRRPASRHWRTASSQAARLKMK